MPRTPRQQNFVNRPSPLQQVSLTRPVSQNPELGLVRDPAFWKRFSAAVHMAEEGGVVGPESARGSRTNSSTSTFAVKDTNNDWLQKQHKEKRRCRILCVTITLLIIILGVGGGVVAWYFLKGRK